MVIAIIAILAAILLPVLNSAEARAQTVQCLNNMKQLQMCYRMYVDDNNDYLPPNESPTYNISPPGITNSWIGGDAQTSVMPNDIEVGKLFQYNQSIKIYACPANPATAKIGPVTPTEAAIAQQSGFTWIKAGGYVPQVRTCSIDFALGGYNAASGLSGAPCTYDGVTTLAKFSQIQLNCSGGVAGKFVFCDEAEISVGDGCLATYPANLGDDAYWNLPGSRHDGRRSCTWSFADGHCELWRWHGAAIINDNSYPFGGTFALQHILDGKWPADPLTGPHSSDDLPRVEAATIVN